MILLELEKDLILQEKCFKLKAIMYKNRIKNVKKIKNNKKILKIKIK